MCSRAGTLPKTTSICNDLAHLHAKSVQFLSRVQKVEKGLKKACSHIKTVINSCTQVRAAGHDFVHACLSDHENFRVLSCFFFALRDDLRSQR